MTARQSSATDKGEKMSYVYKRTEPDLYTVGFYGPDGEWEPESDHRDSEDAARRTAWLNGSPIDDR